MDFLTQRLEWRCEGRLFALVGDPGGVDLMIDEDLALSLSSSEAQSLCYALGHLTGIKRLKRADEAKAMSGRPWTPADDTECRRLFSQNVSIEQISNAMKRSRGAIRSRLAKLNLT